MAQSSISLNKTENKRFEAKKNFAVKNPLIPTIFDPVMKRRTFITLFVFSFGAYSVLKPVFSLV